MADVILIVEDEPDIATTLAYNLKKWGYEVHTAATGEDGRGALKARFSDLVLLDLILPDMSGHEVCAELREYRQTRSVPIIMLTARRRRRRSGTRL